MSDIAPDIFPFLVAALEDERRELDQCILFLIGKLPAQQLLPRSTPVAPLNVKTTLNVKTAKYEKPNNR